MIWWEGNTFARSESSPKIPRMQLSDSPRRQNTPYLNMAGSAAGIPETAYLHTLTNSCTGTRTVTTLDHGTMPEAVPEYLRATSDKKRSFAQKLQREIRTCKDQRRCLFVTPYPANAPPTEFRSETSNDEARRHKAAAKFAPRCARLVLRECRCAFCVLAPHVVISSSEPCYGRVSLWFPTLLLVGCSEDRAYCVTRVSGCLHAGAFS